MRGTNTRKSWFSSWRAACVSRHLEHGVLHLVFRGLAVHGVDDVEPEIVRQSDLVAARLDHAADALIVAGLIEQDQEIGLYRDLE